MQRTWRTISAKRTTAKDTAKDKRRSNSKKQKADTVQDDDEEEDEDDEDKGYEVVKKGDINQSIHDIIKALTGLGGRLEDKAFRLLDNKNELAYPHADDTEPKHVAVLNLCRAITHSINNVNLGLYRC